VAYGLAKNLGHPQLGVVAARRGYDAARRLDDPAMTGFARWYYALSLMRIGARRRVSATLSAATDELGAVADPTGDDTFGAEMYGLLHLTSALESARQDRADDVAAHLREAREIATRTGERNGMFLHFGPSNVSAWALSTGVELGQGGAAYETARREPANVSVWEQTGRGACWYFDLARALAQEGGARDWDAIRHLDTAERIAPQRIRHDPISRELLFALDGRARKRIWELDSLKHRLGIGKG